MNPRRCWIALLVLVIVGCSPQDSPSNTLPMAPPQDLTTTEKRNIAYVPQGGPDQSYDLYWPTANPSRTPPLLVFIHGGAWQTGDKASYKAMGQAFAKLGVVTAIVNYRLSNKAKHPEPIEDVATAIAHLAKNAQGYDPKRIHVVGHSAGAHMCGYLAAHPELMTNAGLTQEYMPKAFIGLEGIYDIPNLVKVWPDYQSMFIEKEFGKESLWPAASPTRLPIKLKVRWLLVHARGDELVDAAQTDDFKNHLTKEGVDLDFHDPGELKHFGVVESLSNPDSDLFKRVVRFIE